MSKIIPSQALRYEKLKSDPTCTRCGETKTIKDFPERAVDYWCNECRKVYAREAYRRKRAAMSKEELAEEKAKINKRQSQRRAERIAAMSASELQAFRDKENLRNIERRKALKDEVYAAYGGYTCACCGEDEELFLSIDHINNDGAEHKREHNLQTGEQMYRWIRRHGFPVGFQVLCMNCQWGKRNNNGVCPHSEKV